MKRLKKELSLFDVYAISTGAMFSSGFFLLPGLAAAGAGPAVVLAYLLAGLLAAPAMLSKAELSTAMPRAGGTYYFLDRSLGPMVGTIGGLGTWTALVLKSAFALVGMGAYLGLFIEVPIRTVALLLTALFVAVNVAGAKQTGGLQRALVAALLAVLAFFVAQGLWEVFAVRGWESSRPQFTPFSPFGAQGLFATVGLVFVSYAGLTKVASVAEEVTDPDRNIPLGMALSLTTATLIYVVGVFVMVAVLDPAELREDLRPVATAAESFFDWLPGEVGLWLVVIAAVAAFASTGNAGIMSASRYLLAMGRDHLVWPGFARLGKFHTPTLAILLSGGLVGLSIVTLDVLSIAKLASAFQLLVFAFVNLAVIIMRESGIAAYDPGFRSPAYPWVQIVGMLAPFVLIATMGLLAILFTVGLIGACLVWYFWYGRDRVRREGALYHVFERLGRRRDEGLDLEMREILKERGAREWDPFDEVIARAEVLERPEGGSFKEVALAAAEVLAREVPADRDALYREFVEETRLGLTPVAHGVALPHARVEGVEPPRLVMVRAPEGIRVDVEVRGTDRDGPGSVPGRPEGRGPTEDAAPAERPAVVRGPGFPGPEPIRAAFFLVSDPEDSGRHLRILAQLAGRADDEGFMEEWLAARNEQELKEAVLRNERYLSLRLRPAGPTASLVDRALRDADLPAGSLVALIRREGELVVPGGGTVLRAGDRLTVIGNPEGIRELARRFASPEG